jgi:hypothetical protein
MSRVKRQVKKSYEQSAMKKKNSANENEMNVKPMTVRKKLHWKPK